MFAFLNFALLLKLGFFALLLYQAWPRILGPRGGMRGGHDSYRPIFPRGMGSVWAQFFMMQSEQTLFWPQFN